MRKAAGNPCVPVQGSQRSNKLPVRELPMSGVCVCGRGSGSSVSCPRRKLRKKKRIRKKEQRNVGVLLHAASIVPWCLSRS
ncbi:hypothetical protein N658DRAFT_300413 [Parathielavia hyrcaniae]|uniref:Uncharacterized protein n=1 Tax=Parathielavia hyrcaniae TaxID=113614 RepID=A0AAN6Q3T6_9PEZI|nr:hypothetical protein N658DRAFT_300413 [Parathielavia hyrcaniae]